MPVGILKHIMPTNIFLLFPHDTWCITGKKKLLKNSQQILRHVMPLGVGFTVTWFALSSASRAVYPMKPTTHWLYLTQNITFGGVIRKYKACALWRRYKHGGVSPTYE
jgi:hypothetical protein